MTEQEYLQAFADGFDNCSQPASYPPAAIAWLKAKKEKSGLTIPELAKLRKWQLAEEEERLKYTHLEHSP